MYILSYTLEDEELETIPFAALQHALSELMLIHEKHDDPTYTASILWQSPDGELHDILHFSSSIGMLVETHKIDYLAYESYHSKRTGESPWQEMN